MTCDHCKAKSNLYNMKNICCLARHVLCKFYGKGESVKEYAIKIAKRYEVDVNDLKQEIINQRKIK